MVNQSLTIRNWLFGHYIVEYEQYGEDRARYGTELLKNIADKLNRKKIKGLSDRNLRNCRQFYLSYPNLGQALSEFGLPYSIWQTPSAKSGNSIKHPEYKNVEAVALLSRLTYSHIIELSREEDAVKRDFYELQALKGNWSVKELQRQMGSFLFERTGLSSNKEGLILDVNNGADQLTPEEIIRDPYVFEFVGLESKEKSTVKYATGSLENQLFVRRYQVQLPTIKELEEFIIQDIKLLAGK